MKSDVIFRNNDEFQLQSKFDIGLDFQFFQIGLLGNFQLGIFLTISRGRLASGEIILVSTSCWFRCFLAAYEIHL